MGWGGVAECARGGSRQVVHGMFAGFNDICSKITRHDVQVVNGKAIASLSLFRMFPAQTTGFAITSAQRSGGPTTGEASPQAGRLLVQCSVLAVINVFVGQTFHDIASFQKAVPRVLHKENVGLNQSTISRVFATKES